MDLSALEELFETQGLSKSQSTAIRNAVLALTSEQTIIIDDPEEHITLIEMNSPQNQLKSDSHSQRSATSNSHCLGKVEWERSIVLDQELNRTLAIEVIHKDILTNPAATARFLEEATGLCPAAAPQYRLCL